MKIAVVTPHYGISGVPLAQWRFARALRRRGHQVELIIGNCNPALSVPPLEGVEIRLLNLPNVRSMLSPLMSYLARERPEVVFSAEDHLNIVVQLAAVLTGSKARLSGSSRVTPFDTYSSRPFSKRWVLKQAARALNWRAQALTCVSRDMVDQYASVFPRERRVCVYNIVDDSASRARLEEPVDHPWFRGSVPLVTAAGSLAPWKGFADLIDSIAVLRDQGRDVRLLILGEGRLRLELEKKVKVLSLGDRVSLLGHVDNPLPYFARSQVFALSSHVEGMPNVLIEAMMAGCTPVAANCPTGPAEVILDDHYGYLVEMKNPAAMAEGIVRALESPINPFRLAEAVRPFEETAVIQQHFKLLGFSEGHF